MHVDKLKHENILVFCRTLGLLVGIGEMGMIRDLEINGGMKSRSFPI